LLDFFVLGRAIALSMIAYFRRGLLPLPGFN
jgi:hypothetical protein